jgi:hypothetical protein
MKIATLYTLTSEKIALARYVPLSAASLHLDWKRLKYEDAQVAFLSTGERTVPVHHIRRIKPPKTRPTEGPVETEDVFFALEPALAEILEIPVRAEVKQEIKTLQAAITELQKDIMAFNRLPWYRKLFHRISEEFPPNIGGFG